MAPQLEWAGAARADLPDDAPDDAAKDAFFANVCDAGGFRTGYGAWVLRPGYKVSSLEGLADPMHY
jgi:hypothetical protein